REGRARVHVWTNPGPGTPLHAGDVPGVHRYRATVARPAPDPVPDEGTIDSPPGYPFIVREGLCNRPRAPGLLLAIEGRYAHVSPSFYRVVRTETHDEYPAAFPAGPAGAGAAVAA